MEGIYIIMDGEYYRLNYNVEFTSKGAIYDPFSNTWSVVPPSLFFDDFFDSPSTKNVICNADSIVLEDGTFMIQNPLSKKAALKTLTWKETGTATKSDRNDEEGWNLLPNGNVLTIDCYNDFSSDNYPLDATHLKYKIIKLVYETVREVLKLL